MSDKPQFLSKSASHILNYESVATAIHFALTYSIVSFAVNRVAAPAWRLAQSTVFSVEPVKANACKVDQMFDQYVLLETLDEKILPFSLQIIHKALSIGNRFLQPVNHFVAYFVFESVLKSKPPKLDRSESQVMYTFTLLHAFLARVRQIVWQTLAQVTSTVSQTYQQEVETARNTVSHPVAQNISASYNTAAISLHNLHASVIQPLLCQTQEIVGEITRMTRSRATSEARASENRANGASTPVSALA